MIDADELMPRQRAEAERRLNALKALALERQFHLLVLSGRTRRPDVRAAFDLRAAEWSLHGDALHALLVDLRAAPEEGLSPLVSPPPVEPTCSSTGSPDEALLHNAAAAERSAAALCREWAQHPELTAAMRAVLEHIARAAEHSAQRFLNRGPLRR